MRTVYSLQIDSYIRLQECCESVEGFLGQELNMLFFLCCLQALFEHSSVKKFGVIESTIAA